MSVICHGMYFINKNNPRNQLKFNFFKLNISGLSLPLIEHETIKDCVNVYCEWLTALYQIPRVSVPRPICEDPNLYARKIINHFHKLFVPRQGEGEPI